MDEAPKKKRLMSKFEWVLLIIAGLILLSIVLQKFGIHVMQKTEGTEMIDRPHAD